MNFLLKLQEEFNLYFVLLRTLSKVLSTVLCPKVKYTLYWVLYSVQKWSILYTEYCTLSKSEVYFILSTVLCPKVKYTLYWVLYSVQSEVYFILSTVLCPKVKYTLYWVLYSVQKWSILYTEYCTLFKSEVYFSWETSDQPKQLYLKKVTRRGRMPPSIIEEQAEFYVLLFIEGTCDICHI